MHLPKTIEMREAGCPDCLDSPQNSLKYWSIIFSLVAQNIWHIFCETEIMKDLLTLCWWSLAVNLPTSVCSFWKALFAQWLACHN